MRYVFASLVALALSSTADAQSREWAALQEVNSARAAQGLRPYIYDHGLSQGAYRVAHVRATNFIAGHTSNDFAYLPRGSYASAAGSGALAPSWGWGTCCTYDNYRYAGASWVWGRDGRRYMQLFVR